MPYPLFAYGTLQPGGRYWPRIASLVTRTQPARLRGFTLYHLDAEGYPCVVDGDQALDGTLLFLREGYELEALAICDEIEGFSELDPSSLYMRRTCHTLDGQQAWLYVFGPAHRHLLTSAATVVDDPSWMRWRAIHRPLREEP